MRLACRYALPLAIVSTITLVANAHPGHAHEVVPADSAWHYFLQPEHAMFSGVLLALPIVLFLAICRRWFAMRIAQVMLPVPVPRRRTGSKR
ncbi:MAG: hypothetical protein ABI557_17425 [Aureliella sp.]